MKKDTHPQYYQSSVSCACGNTFTVGSTTPTIQVEICSNCHPFYTGKQKLVDTARRVEKFQAKQAKANKMRSVTKASKKKEVVTTPTNTSVAASETPKQPTQA